MLSLEGNPLVLTKNYSNIVKERVQGLKVLDGNTVFADADDQAIKAMSMKKKTMTMTRASKTNAGSTTSLESFNFNVEQNCTIDFHLRLLKNIEGGRYLIPDENCTFEVEKLDEIPEEKKSSQYWLTWTNHEGEECSTEKRSYIKHFQVEENDSKTVAKSDVDFKLRIDERPSVELRDWMYNDILLTLWESRPKFELIREEGAEVDVERVVMDDDNELPMTETLNRGVSNLI